MKDSRPLDSSPSVENTPTDYAANTERFLTVLVETRQRIVQTTLHGKPVYIVADVELMKRIFEDGKNFSFTPGDLSNKDILSEGSKAFVAEGLESPLLASSYDQYKQHRTLFNQAFQCGYVDRKEEFDALAKNHLENLLSEITPPTIDAVSLCKRFLLPLMANVIGIDSLPYADLLKIADCAKELAEGHGMQEEGDSVERLASLYGAIVELLKQVIEAGAVPVNSALGSLLQTLDTDSAISHVRAFILGGLDTGSSSLMLSTYLLANNPVQRVEFLKLNPIEQHNAVTELISKEAPAYYSPRFAMNDVAIDGLQIPAGSFIQLALYAVNKCANADFDVRRYASDQCPMHSSETLPFGHARHKCPGEELGRHLTVVFLNGFFSQFSSVTVQSVVKQQTTSSRGLGELVLFVQD